MMGMKKLRLLRLTKKELADRKGKENEKEEKQKKIKKGKFDRPDCDSGFALSSSTSRKIGPNSVGKSGRPFNVDGKR